MSTTTLVIMPAANATYRVSGGTVFTSDSNKVVQGVTATQDLLDLEAMGGIAVFPPPQNLLAKLLGANFNSTADQLFTLLVNAKFRVTKITVTNASISLTVAAGGIYTAASKGGTALVASTQTYTTASSTAAEDLTLAAPNAVLTNVPSPQTLYLSLTTGQGAAATADVYAYGDVYP